MGARSKARKRALDVLYAADLRHESPTEALDRVIADAGAPSNEYTVTLVRGYAGHSADIDELISSYLEGWTLGRMPAVDRNVLRLGVFEMLHVDDVPGSVAISESMALVRDLSTDDSPQFVNGVLAAIARDHATA